MFVVQIYPHSKLRRVATKRTQTDFHLDRLILHYSRYHANPLRKRRLAPGI